MVRPFVLLGALIAAAAAVPTAQQLPDFSGSWTLSMYRGNVNPGAARPSGGSSGAGGSIAVTQAGRRSRPVAEAVTIRQTTGAFTIEEAIDGGTRRTVYALDGSESTNVRGTMTLRTQSRWDDGRLVTEGTQTVSTGQIEVTARFVEVRWLTAEGAMVIETTRTTAGRDPTTSRAEYGKAG